MEFISQYAWVIPMAAFAGFGFRAGMIICDELDNILDGLKARFMERFGGYDK